MFSGIFHLTGFFENRNSKTCFLSIIFQLWLIISLILSILNIIHVYQRAYFTIWISYAASILTSFATYVILWLKKYQILKLKKTIRNFHTIRFMESTSLKVIQVLNIFLFIIYPAVFLFLGFKTGNIYLNVKEYTAVCVYGSKVICFQFLSNDLTTVMYTFLLLQCLK